MNIKNISEDKLEDPRHTKSWYIHVINEDA